MRRYLGYLSSVFCSLACHTCICLLFSLAQILTWLKFINFVFIGLLFGEQFLLILSKIACLLLISVFLCFFWWIETCEKVYRVQAVRVFYRKNLLHFHSRFKTTSCICTLPVTERKSRKLRQCLTILSWLYNCACQSQVIL